MTVSDRYLYGSFFAPQGETASAKAPKEYGSQALSWR